MNWLTNLVRPRLQAFVKPKEVPDNYWIRCNSCEQMLFHRELKENLQVCHHCGYHMPMTPQSRCELLFDQGEYHIIPAPNGAQDPLHFRDLKKYQERLKAARSKTDTQDALLIARGKIAKVEVIVAIFNFEFMAGSMGTAVGEGLVEAAQAALGAHCPLLIITASGGARMQEGILSLMQMPRSIIAIEKLRAAGLPYITLLTHPTTGGVSASFAMLGDIALAEPGAIIGFTGARVIQETIKQTLPPGFQKSEYLLEHGLLDQVLPRKEQPAKIGMLLSLLMQPKQ